MTDAATINEPQNAKAKRSLADRWRNASPFQKSFVEGLSAGAIIFLLLLVWMFLRADRTAEILQPLIPAKHAEIELGAPVIPTVEKEHGDVAPVPAQQGDGLSETENGLTLPVMRAVDDMTVFQAYKRPFIPTEGKAQIAIVIVDFGLSSSLSQAALDTLPADVTLALTPYADNASAWAAKVKASGKELWLSLPMQTGDLAKDDTGPFTILLNAPLEENQNRLFSVLSSANGYVGLISGQDHAFTNQDLDAGPVLKQIFGRGLAFAESNPGNAGFGAAYAAETGAPYTRNGNWIDTDLRPESIDRALQILEMDAMKKGKAVAFVHPYPVVIEKLSAWLKQADQKGLQLAPLSATVQ